MVKTRHCYAGGPGLDSRPLRSTKKCRILVPCLFELSWMEGPTYVELSVRFDEESAKSYDIGG